MREADKIILIPFTLNKGSGMTDILDKLYNREGAARYIREKYASPCTTGLLDKLAVRGTGPAYRKVAGRFVIYEEKSLDEWALAQIGEPQRSTSDSPRPARKPQRSQQSILAGSV
jgi:hypothetical protein